MTPKWITNHLRNSFGNSSTWWRILPSPIETQFMNGIKPGVRRHVKMQDPDLTFAQKKRHAQNYWETRSRKRSTGDRHLNAKDLPTGGYQRAKVPEQENRRLRATDLGSYQGTKKMRNSRSRSQTKVVAGGWRITASSSTRKISVELAVHRCGERGILRVREWRKLPRKRSKSENINIVGTHRHALEVFPDEDSDEEDNLSYESTDEEGDA